MKQIELKGGYKESRGFDKKIKIGDFVIEPKKPRKSDQVETGTLFKKSSRNLFP